MCGLSRALGRFASRCQTQNERSPPALTVSRRRAPPLRYAPLLGLPLRSGVALHRAGMVIHAKDSRRPRTRTRDRTRIGARTSSTATLQCRSLQRQQPAVRPPERAPRRASEKRNRYGPSAHGGAPIRASKARISASSGDVRKMNGAARVNNSAIAGAAAIKRAS